MPMTTMTSKGQVTIPKKVRELLHLKAHDKIAVIPDPAGNKAILRPIHGTILGLKGIFHRKGMKPIDFKKLRREFERAMAERVVKVLEQSRGR